VQGKYKKSPFEFTITQDMINPVSVPEQRDTIFTLSNGLYGCRGTALFCSKGTIGTFVNGLYAEGPANLLWIPPVDCVGRDIDKFPTDKEIYDYGTKWALLSGPNAFHIEAGEGINLKADLEPRLDLKQALLWQEGCVHINGERWKVRAFRFVSKANPHTALEKIEFTPEDENQSIELQLGVDDSNLTATFFNYFQLWEEKKFRKVSQEIMVWEGITNIKHMELSIAFGCRVHGNNCFSEAVDAIGSFKIAGKGAFTIERYIGFSSSVFEEDTANKAAERCRISMDDGFDKNFEDHLHTWEKLWECADIEIGGNIEDQRLVRYNIYQVLSAAVDTDRVSIGAKYLTATGYHGMVFWDMDIYILPNLIRTCPQKARSHLEFRYNCLDEARKKAKKFGYDGAMFSWEAAAPDGKEGTPPFYKALATQVHIVGDISWAVDYYYRWTGDEEFMNRKGREIIAECARFWASRMNQVTGEIEHVCGPDEHNPDVNKNVYTDIIARATLRWGVKYSKGFATEEEKQKWSLLADKIVENQPDERGIIAQFEGFDKLRPEQYPKQADLLVVPLLFPDYFTIDTIRKNYEYYEQRTRHASSLSKGAYANAAAICGLKGIAYNFWRDCASLDLQSTQLNDTMTGLHAAATGSVLFTITSGFCGITEKDGQVIYNVNLPDAWEYVVINFIYNGKRHALKLTDGQSGMLMG
jgi:trehalose/maltose hydrolase-like predicted phosphorylase